MPTLAEVPWPKTYGYSGRINNQLIRLFPTQDTPLNIQNVPVQAQKISTEENPEDFADPTMLTWSRTDFSGGQGLYQAHRRDGGDQDFSRYWSGRNVQPITQFGYPPWVKVTKKPVLLDSNADFTSNRPPVMFNNSLFYVRAASGEAIGRVDNPSSNTPTTGTEDPYTGDAAGGISGLVPMGDYLYVAIATGAGGINRRDTSGTWTDWSALTAIGMWASKSRILAVTNLGAFYDMPTDGSIPATPLITFPTSDSVQDVAEAGSAILVMTRTSIYAFAPDETGALTLLGQTPFPGDETGSAITAFGDIVLYLTSTYDDTDQTGRAWRATLSEGVLVGQEVVYESKPFTGALTTLLSGRDAAWFAHNETHRTTSQQHWSMPTVLRYDFTTGGIVRTHMLHGTATSQLSLPQLALDGNWLYLKVTSSVAEPNDTEIYRIAPHDTTLPIATYSGAYPDDAYLITPLIDFYTTAYKAWESVEIEVSGSGYIEVWYSTNPDALLNPYGPTWTKIGQANAPSTTTIELPIEPSESLTLLLKFHPQDNVSPELRSIAVRAYPTALRAGLGGPQEILSLPVNVSDQVEIPGRSRVRVKGEGDRQLNMLHRFRDEVVEIELFPPWDAPGPRLFTGMIQSISAPMTVMTNRGSQGVVSVIEVLGRAESIAASGADNLWGSRPPWGMSPLWGTGQSEGVVDIPGTGTAMWDYGHWNEEVWA